MNFYSEILKLKAKILALNYVDVFGVTDPSGVSPTIYCTTDKTETLEGNLPAVAIEDGKTNGQYLSTGQFNVAQHNATIWCCVSAHEIAYDLAKTNAEKLATEVMKQMHGLKIRVKQDGIDRAELSISSEKAVAVILDCICYE